MVLAYTTPKGWSLGAMIAYAAITNALLMTHLLHEQHALLGARRGDDRRYGRARETQFLSLHRREHAQFVVGGFTLPLVAKFAVGHDRQYGWRMTMTLWAGLCLVLFLITFLATRERIQPVQEGTVVPKAGFRGPAQEQPVEGDGCS